MSSVPQHPRERRQMLRNSIEQRARRGLGGGVGSDWAERRRAAQVAAPPGRNGRMALLRGLVLAGFVLVCGAATVGGTFLVWNGQNSSELGLNAARSVLEDRSCDPNLRRSAAATLFTFGDEAIVALRAGLTDEDQSVREACEVWLAKLARRVSIR